MTEFDNQINILLHRIMRVIDDIVMDRRAAERNRDREIQALLLARQEILQLVNLKAKENGNG